MDLDDLLARSAPPPTPRSAELDWALARLVADAEKCVRNPRRRRIGLVASGAVALIGVGTAGAMASGLLSVTVPWSTGEGQSCSMKFTAAPRGADGEAPSTAYSTADQRAAAQSATTFLSSIDYSSIDTDEAIEQWQRAEDAASATEPAGEQQPRLTGDDLEISAVGRVVWQQVEAHLRAEGYATPADAVSFNQGWACR